MKLFDNFSKTMSNNNFTIIKQFAKESKDTIEKGKLRELTDATKEARSKGLTSFGVSVNPSHDPKEDVYFKPLMYSEDLFNSIKANKAGIEMLDYGVKHHKGFTTPPENIGYGANKIVPPRKFIPGFEGFEVSKNNIEFLEIKTVKAFNKAMKK